MQAHTRNFNVQHLLRRAMPPYICIQENLTALRMLTLTRRHLACSLDDRNKHDSTPKRHDRHC